MINNMMKRRCGFQPHGSPANVRLKTAPTDSDPYTIVETCMTSAQRTIQSGNGHSVPLSTAFAPAERATSDELQRQVTFFQEAPVLLQQMVSNIPDILTVLNENRQIVYVNQVLLDFLGLDDPSSIWGLRPGEVLDCAHAVESDGGCGTTEFCQTCGAVQAILASQKGKKNIQECRILQRGGEALDLRVWATPLEIGADRFTIFAVTDISHEKRRRALERIFFHDILNTAGGLWGFAGLLDEANPEDLDEIKRTIYDLSGNLIDEINAQHQLSAAESEELIPEHQSVISINILTDVMRTYKQHLVAQGKAIHMDPAACVVEMMTDPTILRRVLGNMTKNALEASEPGQTVTLGCDRAEGWVRFWVHNPKVMSRPVQLQLFQRSFSTKGAGRGLGAYSMKLLSERYLHGQVSFVSEEGRGTIFMAQYPVEVAALEA